MNSQVTLSNQPTGRNEVSIVVTETPKYLAIKRRFLVFINSLFVQVRKRSYVELEIFKNRWKKAVKEDNCWVYSLKESQKQ